MSEPDAHGCRGCPDAPAGTWVGHRRVEPLGQYESADRLLELASGRTPLTADPLWWRSGAPTPLDYAAWAPRVCGLACLRMALAHWGAPVPSTFELIRGCQPFGVYDAGGPASPGLRYRPFVEYLRAAHGVTGEVVERSIHEAVSAGTLAGGGMVIWSVHFGIRHPDRTPPSTGGHLVLVHAFDPDAGTIAFTNPSGHTADTRAAQLPLATFERFAARRGMALAMPAGLRR